MCERFDPFHREGRAGPPADVGGARTPCGLLTIIRLLDAARTQGPALQLDLNHCRPPRGPRGGARPSGELQGSALVPPEIIACKPRRRGAGKQAPALRQNLPRARWRRRVVDSWRVVLPGPRFPAAQRLDLKAAGIVPTLGGPAQRRGRKFKEPWNIGGNSNRRRSEGSNGRRPTLPGVAGARRLPCRRRRHTAKGERHENDNACEH